MRHSIVWLAGLFLAATTPIALGAVLVDVPMNAQINLGYTYNSQSPSGDAIYSAFNSGPQTIWPDGSTDPISGSVEPEGWTRHDLDLGAGAASWWYQYIDFNLAGISTPAAGLDLSHPCARIEFDARFYQDPNTNSNPYGDAPIFPRLYTYGADGNTYLGHREFNIRYGPNAGYFPFGDWYPTWAHVVVFINSGNYTDGGTFDVTNVSRIRFYGTDWSGGGDDFVDFKNFIITDDPLPPVITPVQPDPQTAYADIPYTQQVLVDSCETVTWTLLQGPSGAYVDTAGLVQGWTPTQAQAGQTFTFEVQATNTAGSATDVWQVTVYQPPPSDGSNIAQPWGTLHGNIYATQSSDDPSLLFDSRWSNDARVDWTYAATTDGLTGTTERGGITFDESGNLYWKTTEGLLASLAPDKTLRWKANDAGTPVDLGQGDTTTPLVGDGGETGRVYVLGDLGLYAFRKSDGVQLWATALPDANFATTGDRLNPLLYEGRVYVVGAGATTKTVYEIDAATGTVVWAKPIAVNLDTGWGDAKGAMTLLPNALGAGIHGLYFNADGSGDGTDVYCIAINTSTYSGSLQWMADGGKATRSHVIYSANTGRLYTATWGDDGKQFYSFSPTTGLLFGNNSPEGSGHGYNDFGVLDFNGTDVIAAGFGGNVIRYHDTGDGSTTSTFYPTSSNYGEFRMYGGLYKDANGDSIAVMGTRSMEGPNARVLAFNATTEPQVACSSYEDSGVYIDNLKITHGATGVETTRLDVAGFEGYTLGDLPGQANPGGTGTATWEDDTGGGPSAVGMVQVVDSLPAGGSGKGILVDAAGGCGGWQGVFANIGGSLTDTVVVVSWDQYRGDLTDNEWFAEDISWSGWWAMAWDSNGSISPRGFDAWTPLTAGVWQHIEYRFDFGAATPTVTVSVNGVPVSANLDAAETSIRGWDFEVEGTLKDDDFTATPITPIFSFDTGTVDVISGLQMGPVVGDAAQHIYYWVGDTLTALTFVTPQPGDFNGDGDVDEDDLDVFQSCATGPGIGGPPAGCSADDFSKADFNSDEDVDQSDFAGFQRCYSGTDVPGNVDCLGL